MKRRNHPRASRPRKNRGQAISEYILLMAILFGLFLTTLNALDRVGFPELLAKNLLAPYSAAYQYGHPLARGPDNGGPTYIPNCDGTRVPSCNGDGNFRIFLNPSTIH